MTTHPKDIRIEHFNYSLPDERIAKHPLPLRDSSKLLIYDHGLLNDIPFNEIPSLLSATDTLVLNDTKVIPARIIFRRTTGASIELFCLEPIGHSHQDAMIQRESSSWKCLVGGAKKWKTDEQLRITLPIEGNEITLTADKISREADFFNIRFSWSDHRLTFSEILQLVGEIPLPPYFNRKAEDEDLIRYQTVFAMAEGSVAAPTAALHFTAPLFDELRKIGVERKLLTLHVGAGTFRPVSSETLEGHNMHSELFSVDIELIGFLKTAMERRIIAVGTTTMRTLESLYWLGVKLKEGTNFEGELPSLGQWECYELNNDIDLISSIDAILQYCSDKGLREFAASTSIIITPGYKFKVCRGLITNFHMPQSTLLLLVSAFVGEDWKKIYDYALKNDFRFLSYGDSSILLP